MTARPAASAIPEFRDSIAPLLLAWYRRHARILPWRAAPGSPPSSDPDWPYRVWLSEVMLQQTTVAAVKPYFAKFIARWPNVAALAAAPEDEVMAAWAGLGYYSRARNLVACAREVAALGRFPHTERDLRALPGLGAYTAAAVAAIAFGERAVVIDANVERVVARLYAVTDPLPAARKALYKLTDQITPASRSGDFAQAMMDIGSGICTSRDPQCQICPLADLCAARKQGDPARFPVKPAKKATPTRQGTAFWIERGNKVWLVTRAGKGMLGGMRALPDDGWRASGDGTCKAPIKGTWQPVGLVRHSFTHFALELTVSRYASETVPQLQNGEWWPLDRLEAAGLPTLFAKAARLARAQD